MNKFSGKQQVITSIILGTCLVFILRLFYLQVVDDSYKSSAENNSQRRVTQYPARGLILDRNRKEIVTNEAAYDLMVTPQLTKKFDTTELCQILGISREQVASNLRAARNYSRYKPSAFLNQLSAQTYASLQEKMYKFPGFFVQPRTLRHYVLPIAPHLLGYVGEVDQRILDKDPYYKTGDYIGITGIEKAYENVLRGQKGVKVMLVDVHNVVKGSFQDGEFDTIAITGKDLICTIDRDLQYYAETLMRNMRGSLVAIEPSTGEILAMVSMPSYDPSLLVGRERSANFSQLNAAPGIPLLNRSVNARYSPGSTFKPAQALVCLQMGGITENTLFPCNGPESSPIKCTHHHGSPVSLLSGIEQSCNPYFWGVFRTTLEMGGPSQFKANFNRWREDMMSFGLGRTLETDLPDIQAGNIPSEQYFTRYFGANGWRPMTIRSLAIGQGEILVTPLQMANLSAIIANQGFYYPPHTVRDSKFNTAINTKVEKKYFELVTEGMYRVLELGTGRAYKIPGVDWCGKTGTVQNPPNKDHSLFMGFAPRENPRIAVAVVVENAGYGATWATPIASLIVEKYLTGKVERKWIEDRLNTFSIY